MHRALGLAVLTLLAACGSAASSDGDAAPDEADRDAGDGEPSAVAVTEVVHLDDIIIRAQDLGDGRVGVITDVPAYTDTVCPDCEDQHMPDDECPAACSRERLEWSVIDADGSVALGPVVLRTFVPPWYAIYLGYVQTARLASGEIAATWTLCEGPPARSCRAEYAVFTETGESVVAPTSLYQGFYGEVAMTVNPGADTVLVVRSSELVTRAGVWAAVLATDGTVLRDFTRVGSSTARAAAIAADGDGYVIVAEDHAPLADDAACPPCARLDACIGEDPACSFGGQIAPEAGLWAFHLDAAGAITTAAVATGWSEGLYQPHETYAVASLPSGLAVTSWWRANDDLLMLLTRSETGWAAATMSLAELAVEAPVRWLGLLDAGERPGELHLVGEAIALGATAAQPHAFIAAERGTRDDLVGARIGEPFRGHGFGPTGAFTGDSGLVSAGILDEAGTSYDHWSVSRFTVAER